jgi:hypothetical protein
LQQCFWGSTVSGNIKILLAYSKQWMFLVVYGKQGIFTFTLVFFHILNGLYGTSSNFRCYTVFVI